MGDGFEYRHGPGYGYEVYLPTVQAVDGSTPVLSADVDAAPVVLAEAVDVAGLDPANDAASQAAGLFAEATVGGPLAGRVGGMTVDEVLPLLDVLDPVELAEVRDAEVAGKARKTLLFRMDELLPDAVDASTDGGEV